MITTLQGGQRVEYASFSLADMVSWGYDKLRSIGPVVSEGAVQGLPALHRAARLRAEALASLRLRCWRGEGPSRERVENAWQADLFSRRPNEWQSRFAFWETIGESLAWRNNSYIWKLVDPDTYRILNWYALHPDQVKCEGEGRYKVTVRKGYIDPIGRGEGEYKLDYTSILHVRGHGAGGTWEAPSPIQVFREALASPVARQRHEAKMWWRGTALQLAVNFPEGITQKQAEEWRPGWEAAYEGPDGASTAVIGGGAEIQKVGMTMVDAQFVQMANLTVDDAARIMGVPGNLLGAKTADGAIPNLEQDLATWLRFGLGPELERVESALLSDETLFAPYGRSIYPAFETQDFVRGDVMTEDTIAHQQIQDGRLLPDEWRLPKGLPPLPGGVGKIPQVVPVGGGANPVPPGGSSNGKKTEVPA